MYSARLAWKRAFFRGTAIGLLAFVVGVCAAFVWRVFPAAEKGGAFVLHYNIYLGIDDVRPWSWVFVLPVLWLTLLLLALFSSFGFYQKDRHLAQAILLGFIGWSLPMALFFFYLSLTNLR